MTTHNTDRKKEEWACLDLLARLDPDFPRGRIVAGESPDFLVFSGHRKVNGIELTRLTNDGPGAWAAGAFFKPALTRETLQGLILSKEKKLPHYKRQKLHRIWLVIVVNGFSHSPAFNLPNQLESWRITSSFDRVLLLDLSSGSFHEVWSKVPRY